MSFKEMWVFKFIYKMHLMATSNPPSSSHSSKSISAYHFSADSDWLCEDIPESALPHSIALYSFFPTLGCMGFPELWGVNIHETTLLNEHKLFSFFSSYREAWAKFIRLLRRSTWIELTRAVAKSHLILYPWMFFSFPVLFCCFLTFCSLG